MTTKISPDILAVLDKPPYDLIPADFRAQFLSENLHEYLDGGAERYLGYGFQELVVREYIFKANKARIRAEIYLMDRPVNAYGIFSTDREGENPGSVGTDAVLGENLLQFWQGPYFVRIQDSDLVGGVKETLLSFGRLISAACPKARPSDRPDLISLLPRTDRIESSVCYFHTQNSLNSLVYLGEENLLGLGLETEAISAEYRFGTAGEIVRIIIIRYKAANYCQENLNNFERGRSNIPELARSRLSHVFHFGKYLLVVFGKAESSWISLLEQKLEQ